MSISTHADSKSQPTPTGAGKPVVLAVVGDLCARAEVGEAKYGTLLRTENGRNAKIDAYQEALDLVMYLKQSLMEDEKPCQSCIGLGEANRALRGMVAEQNQQPLDKMVIEFTKQEAVFILDGLDRRSLNGPLERLQTTARKFLNRSA